MSIGWPGPERVLCGSALKFGLLAEGSADLYPRLARLSEWDVAAGHARAGRRRVAASLARRHAASLWPG